MKKALKRSLSVLLAITIIFSSAYVGLGEIDFSVINFSGLFEIKAKAANEEYLKFLISDSGTYYSLSDCETVAEGEVVIPSTYSGLPVKEIADHAFENCSLITSVVIPSSVTSIGYQAFYNCIKLESVDIPNSVKSLGGSVFENCESLKSVVIPDSVTSTNYYAFKNCKSLISVTIGKGLKTIDSAFFSGCTSLESVVIPSNITTIESSAFSNCTSLSSVVIGSNVKTIESSAFSYCTSLKTVNIPSSVTTLGERAFDFCSGLESFSVDSNNLYYTAYEGVLFNKSKTTLIHYPAKKENTSYTIPSTVVSTGWRAFCDADNLLSVDIPNNVKVLGRDAFFRCDNLVSVKLSNNITALQGRSFGECKSLESIVIPESVESIDSDEFQNCVSLSNVAFGSNVKSIDMRAFNGCTSLESIDLPDGVTSIGNEVFSGCTNLKYIDFGESLTTISEYACYNCSSLETVKIPASVTTIYKTSFRECSQFSVYITDIAAWAKITISGATDDDSSILYDRKLYLNGELAKNIVIPGTVTEIYKYAFSGCKSIETVEILDGVKTVGGFSRCSNLKSIKMADSVTAINFPFEFCGKLETIELSDSITSLPKYAFQFCNSLKSIVLPAKVTTLNTMCFYSCNSLESITIPKTLTVVNDFSFSSCSGLKYVFYEGSEDDWGQIEIGNYNEELEQAAIHYNSTDHTYEWIDVTSATCEAEGVKDYKCLYCNLQKDSANIPALGHSFTEWTVNKEVTCESDGEKVRTCINCGKEEVETTTAKGHEFSEWTVSKEPTCEAEGAKYRECTSCGETETEVISATGHNYSTEWTIDIAATCTENGSKSHHCLNCGDKADVTEIIATGHIVGEWVVTTEPTCSQEGEKTGYCSECGEAYVTEAVSTTEHNYDYDNYEYVINPDNSAEVVKEHKCKDCDATTFGEETYIAVRTVDDLRNIDNDLTASYVLMNDIDLSEATTPGGKYDFNGNGWKPIGNDNSSSGSFSGVLDGNGYKIIGMRIDDSGTSSKKMLGLFGSVTGTVENLSVSGSIKVSDLNNVRAGAICGFAKDAVIRCCSSYCKIELSPTTDAHYAGGIVGMAENSTQILQCYNRGDVSGFYSGGIVGYWHMTYFNASGKASDCYNTGKISGASPAGIVGYSSDYYYTSSPNFTELLIDNCYNRGNFNGSGTAIVYIQTAKTTTVSNCYYLNGLCEAQTGATSLSESDMQLKDSYNGFDFTSTWFIDNSTGYPYPQLRNNPHRGGCAHIYSDWVVDTEATCEADGSKHRTCESCGEVETEVIPATGHNYSTEWTIDTEATCTENGSKSHHCLNCGDKVDVTEIIATGHTVGEWVVTTEPTCSQEGEKTGYCSECGEACVTEAVPTTEHNYDYDNYEYVINPDNSAEVVKEHKCKDCDATILGNETFIAVLTVDDLYNVRNNLSGKYVLMNDIDLTEATSVNGAYDFMDNGWNPIGSDGKYGAQNFRGSFDGNGYEVKGMRIEVTTVPSGASTLYLGLFANVVVGTVKNLSVSGSIKSSVYNEKYVGAICGYLVGTIENCSANCEIVVSNINTTTKNSYAGGIVGYADNGSIISQCYNTGNISGTCVGGILGYGYMYSSQGEITVKNCYNIGSLVGTTYCGGIVGRDWRNYTSSYFYIEDCYNRGNISSDKYCMIENNYDREPSITTSYYLEGLGKSQSGAIALNEQMMRKQSAYTGFDFDNIWVMDTSNGYLYPQLRNNLHRGGCHHIYSDWVVDAEATCEADGSKHRTCENCGEVETEVIPATGHDYSTEWTIDTEATCTENGSKSHHCLNCGDKVDVTEIIATGHIVGEWVVTTEPTCSQEGEKVGYCAECGEVCATEAIPTTAHNYNYDNYEYVKNPENPDEYHKQYECEDCGSTKLDENSAVIKSLIIESLPDKTTYVEGQAIDTTGLVIKLEFEDGTTEVITDYDIVYDNSVPGEQDVTVSFGNVTASFKVTFTAKNLVSIAITKMPDKTTYVIGDSFDRKGMVVTATYNNGLTEEVTGYTVSALPQIEGKNNLMVSFGGKRTVIQVTVIAKKAVSMTVIDPEKFEYVLGDEFDPTGMVVTVTFNNGAVEEVTDYTIEGFGDFTGVGYVTLKYEDLSYEIAILMHAPADFWIVESEATCTTDGLKHLYCTVCKEIAKSEVISATGHDCTETTIKEATCLEKGTKKFDCKHCDYSYTEEFGGGHIISGEKVTIEPTCEAEGVKYSLCSVCGETVGAPIAISALGHNYSDEFTVDVEATCSQPGSKSRHCSRCDAKTDVTAIDSSIHDYTDWVVTTPAGCETDGERTRSCTDCGEYFTETIVALGHAYSIIWTTDKTPTCTVDGSKSHHCNRCGDKKDITVIPATGHIFGEWVLLEETTCTVNGQRVRMCSTCYMEDVEILTAPGHTRGEWTIDANAGCENDGARHTNCTVCGTVVNETIKAYGHDYESVFTVDKEATCIESGLKSHHCSRCEEKTDVTTILPLGHHISTMWTIDTEPTCETEGSKSHHCLRCDTVSDVTVIPVASHIYGKWYVVTPATMDEAGVRAHKCYNCEMTEEAELPKLLKYTATFVADGDVVATVDFPEDATEIEVPEVPHKDKFNGEWENFDIRNKNFTVNAVYTPIPAEQIDGLTAGNKADYYSSTGEVEINLNVSAESKTIVTTTTKAVPLDIVFVLDQSGSMAEYGRKNALKNAVSSFSNAILEDAQKYSVDHRIAVVGFASGNNDGLNYGNTELLTSKTVKYNNITDADYKNALVYVNNNGALNSVISSAINNIDAEGATKADLGLEMASNIFANNPVTGNRQRVVVFLTDGVPTKYSSFEYSVANGAIQNAYQIKNTYDATIYSVGVFDRSTSADRSVNNFMNYVSSNYNEEVVMSRYSKETTENKNGYYLDVSDVSTLSDVFTSIVEETTTHTGRFSNATLKYTLTKYFTLTSVQEEAIRKNAMEKLGVTNEQISITRNADGTTTIVIKGVEPWADEDRFVIDFTFRATANGNTLKSGTYQVGTFESGVILENGEGYEAVFAPNSVDIGGTSGIAVFNINNIPYAINRLSSTTKVVAPATSFGEDYNFIGWNVPANLTLNNEVRVFDAELLKGEYKISWNIDGEITEVKYAVGDFIRVPHVGNNSIGGAFAGWDKEIPETMPSENLTITAVYDAHYHKYDVTKNFKNCEEGGTLTYTCACGDTYTEEIEACEHDWEVITASNNQNAIENAGSRCTVCGVKDSKALRLEGKDIYQEPDASYNTATVELDYVDEEGNKYQPEGDIEISVQLDEVFEQDVPVDATASVYRINDDGTRTMLPSEQNGMNITFETDHFSTYEFEYNTGNRRNIFAQKGTSIDYENKIIFSDTYLAKEFKSLVTYLIPSTLKTVKNEYGYFGTGAEMNLTKDSATESYKVIINGDLNGDGVCDVLDASYAALVASGKQTATEDEIYAANGEVADVIDVEDYQSVVNKVVA